MHFQNGIGYLSGMKTTLLFLSVFLSANLFGQNVYIPDVYFKLYLVTNPDINTSGDNEIQVGEASAYDGEMDLYGQGIFDLTGIEAFTSITFLDVSDNGLITLDVSQNSALEYLNCNDNQLTSINLNGADALIEFDCGSNQLTSLDISSNTALEYLDCDDNQLTILNVIENTALTNLFVTDNQLTTLDVSQNNALIEFDCSGNQLNCLNMSNGNNTDISFFYATPNPPLNCIEVDNVDWANTNWYDFDIIPLQASFSEDCNNDCSSSTVGLTQLTTSKNLIQIVDMMGRETSFKPNTPLIYVCDDGSIEKVFSVEY